MRLARRSLTDTTRKRLPIIGASFTRLIVKPLHRKRMHGYMKTLLIEALHWLAVVIACTAVIFFAGIAVLGLSTYLYGVHYYG